jgi:hypothetical protein
VAARSPIFRPYCVPSSIDFRKWNPMRMRENAFSAAAWVCGTLRRGYPVGRPWRDRFSPPTFPALPLTDLRDTSVSPGYNRWSWAWRGAILRAVSRQLCRGVSSLYCGYRRQARNDVYGKFTPLQRVERCQALNLVTFISADPNRLIDRTQPPSLRDQKA